MLAKLNLGKCQGGRVGMPMLRKCWLGCVICQGWVVLAVSDWPFSRQGSTQRCSPSSTKVCVRCQGGGRQWGGSVQGGGTAGGLSADDLRAALTATEDEADVAAAHAQTTYIDHSVLHLRCLAPFCAVVGGACAKGGGLSADDLRAA
jgi:hypothetical protein